MSDSAITTVPVSLSIAGSEASGAAGAQVDLKTFQALGTFGIVALTCIVSVDPENEWVHRFVPIEPSLIADQLEAEFACHTMDAVKTGMLGTPGTIEVVAAALAEHAPRQLVVDPVLICKGQEPGMALDTDNALKSQILPRATFVTPNQFEALTLAGMESIESENDLIEAAKRVYDLCGAAVLAKGGVRLAGPDAVDVFYDGSTLEVLRAPKVGDYSVNGAGCSLAAAVTAELAKGATPLEAARTAKAFVRSGIRNRVPSRSPFDSVHLG